MGGTQGLNATPASPCAQSWSCPWPHLWVTDRRARGSRPGVGAAPCHSTRQVCWAGLEGGGQREIQRVTLGSGRESRREGRASPRRGLLGASSWSVATPPSFLLQPEQAKAPAVLEASSPDGLTGPPSRVGRAEPCGGSRHSRCPASSSCQRCHAPWLVPPPLAQSHGAHGVKSPSPHITVLPSCLPFQHSVQSPGPTP